MEAGAREEERPRWEEEGRPRGGSCFDIVPLNCDKSKRYNRIPLTIGYCHDAKLIARSYKNYSHSKYFIALSSSSSSSLPWSHIRSKRTYGNETIDMVIEAIATKPFL